MRSLDCLSADDGARLLALRGAKGTETERRQSAMEYGGHCLSLALLGSLVGDALGGDITRRCELGLLGAETGLSVRVGQIMIAYERWFSNGPERSVLFLLGLFDRPATEAELRKLRERPPILGLTDTLFFTPNGTSVVHGDTAIPVSEERWNLAVAALVRAGLVVRAGSSAGGRTLDTHPIVREHFAMRARGVSPEGWRDANERLYQFLGASVPSSPRSMADMLALYAAVVHGCKAGHHMEALVEVFWKKIRGAEPVTNIRKVGVVGAELAVLSKFFQSPWEALVPEVTETWSLYVWRETGIALRILGRMEEASTTLSRALELSIAASDLIGAAMTSIHLVGCLLETARIERALTEAERGVLFAEATGNGFLRTHTRVMYACALQYVGRMEESMAVYMEAESMQAMEFPGRPLLHVGTSNYQYCVLLLERKMFVEVRARVGQILTWRDEESWIFTRSLDWLCLARAIWGGSSEDNEAELEDARSYLMAAVKGLRDAGYQEILPYGLLTLADFCEARNELSVTSNCLQEVLDISMRMGLRIHEAEARARLVRLHLRSGRVAAAFEESVLANELVRLSGYYRSNVFSDLHKLASASLADQLCKLPRELIKAIARELGAPLHYVEVECAPAQVGVNALVEWGSHHARVEGFASRCRTVIGEQPQPGNAMP